MQNQTVESFNAVVSGTPWDDVEAQEVAVKTMNKFGGFCEHLNFTYNDNDYWYDYMAVISGGTDEYARLIVLRNETTGEINGKSLMQIENWYYVDYITEVYNADGSRHTLVDLNANDDGIVYKVGNFFVDEYLFEEEFESFIFEEFEFYALEMEVEVGNIISRMVKLLDYENGKYVSHIELPVDPPTRSRMENNLNRDWFKSILN